MTIITIVFAGDDAWDAMTGSRQAAMTSGRRSEPEIGIGPLPNSGMASFLETTARGLAQSA